MSWPVQNCKWSVYRIHLHDNNASKRVRFLTGIIWLIVGSFMADAPIPWELSFLHAILEARFFWNSHALPKRKLLLVLHSNAQKEKWSLWDERSWHPTPQSYSSTLRFKFCMCMYIEIARELKRVDLEREFEWTNRRTVAPFLPHHFYTPQE